MKVSINLSPSPTTFRLPLLEASSRSYKANSACKHRLSNTYENLSLAFLPPFFQFIQSSPMHHMQHWTSFPSVLLITSIRTKKKNSSNHFNCFPLSFLFSLAFTMLLRYVPITPPPTPHIIMTTSCYNKHRFKHPHRANQDDGNSSYCFREIFSGTPM